jgi:exopolysaccharide biosynthesis predicted pyruvyltransferase EpsI
MTSISKTSLVTAEQIKQCLHDSLANLPSFEECALFGYPNSGNLGDNLIWLGEVFYLTNVLGVKIKYATTGKDFSAVELERKVGRDAPIILEGGGSFGDLYSNHQFHKDIILRYRDRPIIIFPQTLYFTRKENLLQSAQLFNTHPNLTIFARDDYSFMLANQHFSNCRVFKAPDIAFQLAGMPGFSALANLGKTIWYLRRQDGELAKPLDDILDTANLVTEDWVSYKNKWIIGESVVESLQRRFKRKLSTPEVLLVQAASQIFRETWQRGLATPQEWLTRQKWQLTHPDYGQLFKGLDSAYMNYQALSFVISGIHQIQRHRMVVTSRLHGHISCVLLGVPNIFLPNSYYKNKAFYDTWTASIPFSRFAENPMELKSSMDELLSSSPLSKDMQ